MGKNLVRMIVVQIFLLAGVCPTESLAQATSAQPGPVLAPLLSGNLKFGNFITFSEFPVGTFITNQYASQGIVFGGDRPFISGDRSTPTAPVLSGSPQFLGSMEGRFIKPGGNPPNPGFVNGFTLSAGYFDNPGSVRLSWFDGQDRLLGQATNVQRLGIRVFNVTGIGISRWRIEAINTEVNGFAIDNLGFDAPKRAIFVGIFGAANPVEVNDDPDRSVDIWRNSSISALVKSNVSFCNTGACLPRNDDHLAKIGASEVGGLVSLGFFMTSIAGVSSLNTPGNSEVPKSYIVSSYKPGDNVYVVGFSAGGGDAQNLLEKLNNLRIPVTVSGHIDSVEVGDDATIPANTKVARGYYQVQSARLVRGEDKLVAKNPKVTSVTNTKITSPVGPADPKTDDNAYHRNMDNDPRVWKNLQGVILSSLGKSFVSGPIKEALPEAETARSTADWISVLDRALETDVPGEELYSLREEMAQAIQDGAMFRDALVEYNRAQEDSRLQENIAAVLLKVNPSKFVSEVEDAVGHTEDYPVFIAVIHSLARVSSVEANQAVIRLVASNKLDAAPGKVIDAVASAYSDGVEADKNIGWMREWVRSGKLTDYQMYAMARIVEATRTNPEIHSLLRDLVERIQDQRLKAKVEVMKRD